MVIGTRLKIKSGKAKMVDNPIELFSKKASIPNTKVSRAQKQLASSKSFWNVNKNTASPEKINYMHSRKKHSKMKNTH
jgi:hypothetical protein